MATLVLTQLWINRVDTGEGYGYYSADREMGKGTDGEVRKYAGGRRRAVTQLGVTSSFQVKLMDLTVAQQERIEDWVGILVQIRDHRGKIWTGTYFDTSTSEIKAAGYNVSFTLTEVTVPEGV